MREFKSFQDYVGPIHQELKEKYNMDIPEEKITKILRTFLLRIKESLFSKRVVYIDNFMYFSFNTRKAIENAKLSFKVPLTQKERLKQAELIQRRRMKSGNLSSRTKEETVSTP